jgi:hypothetical protein
VEAREKWEILGSSTGLWRASASKCGRYVSLCRVQACEVIKAVASQRDLLRCGQFQHNQSTSTPHFLHEAGTPCLESARLRDIGLPLVFVNPHSRCTSHKEITSVWLLIPLLPVLLARGQKRFASSLFRPGRLVAEAGSSVPWAGPLLVGLIMLLTCYALVGNCLTGTWAYSQPDDPDPGRCHSVSCQLQILL